MRRIMYCLLGVVVMLNAPAAFAIHNEEKGPEKFGRYEFKEQDIDAATKACDADGKPGPEFVPTVRDKQPNLALLKDAKAEASSLLAGWCPHRHCTEYLNDGFYNNCRSWIIDTIPGWAEIDIGAVANVNRIFFASDHSQGFIDRTAADFDILVATTKADANSMQIHGKKSTPTRGHQLAKLLSLHLKM